LHFRRQQQHPAAGRIVDHQRHEPLERVRAVVDEFSVNIARVHTSW
jgi:hypothetical protein